MILAAIVTTLRTLAGLRWVTQDIDDDLEKTAWVVISRRDKEQRHLTLAGALTALGLLGYLVAVVMAAWVNGTTG